MSFLLYVKKPLVCTHLSMIVEAVLLGDLVGRLRSAGHVNGELIRIDRHWSRPRFRFRSRTSQQRAHNQQRHPEDHCRRLQVTTMSPTIIRDGIYSGTGSTRLG